MAEALTALAGLATIVQMAIAAGMKAKSHKHNVQALVRRLKLVPPLIEEVRASRTPLTEAQLNVFENLEHAMQRAKDLLTKCSENSKLYMVFRGDSIVQKFRDVGLDLDRCLSALPLVQLKVSDGTLEKIEEVSVALRETKFKVDVVDQNLSLKIAEALKEQREAQRVNEELLRSLATQLDLTTVQASRAEEKGLLRDRDEARAEKERGEEAYINQIIHLLDTLELADASSRKDSPKSVLTPPPQPPDEFRCPVSLDLMADPVILDSGHTFERAYIQKWLDDGHRTCPISRKPLSTLKLIPNQTLKGMIITWCEKNHVPQPTLPVLRMEPLADVAPDADVAPGADVAPDADVAPAVLEGFKGLRFNNDFSGSSAEWEEYEIEERGTKKRRGLSKFEEELSRFAGHQSGLSELFGKPGVRRSKADEMVRGVEASQQRLMLYNIESETGGSGPIAEGLAHGAPNPDPGLANPNANPSPEGAKNPNSGQFSDGFSALGDLYNSGSLKLGDSDTYANFDIRDIMCESPLHGDSLPGPAGDDVISPIEYVILPVDDVSSPQGDGLLGFGEASTSQGGGLLDEPKFKLNWARRNADNKLPGGGETEPSTSYRAAELEAARTLGAADFDRGYQDSRLKPQSLKQAHSVGAGFKAAEGQLGLREKRSLPADFQFDTSLGPSYRHTHKEHLRPLARGGINVRGAKNGGASRTESNIVGLDRRVSAPGFGSGGNGGLMARGSLDWVAAGIAAGSKSSKGKNGANGGLPGENSVLAGGVKGLAGVNAARAGNGFGGNGLGGNAPGGTGLGGNGLAANGLSGDGLRANGLGGNGLWLGRNGLGVNGPSGNTLGTNGLGGNGLGANGLSGNGLGGNGRSGNGLGANALGANGLDGDALGGNGLGGNGLGGNGLGGNGLGANVQRPATAVVRSLGGGGGVSSRRTFSQQLHHFDWEIDGLDTRLAPSGGAVPGPSLVPNGRDRPGSSRRSTGPERQEGRLEGAASHRRGPSLPQEPAGRSPPLRSPRSPPMRPILDDFLLDAPADSPRGIGHRVTAPQPDGQATGLTNSAGNNVEKPKLYLTSPEEVLALLESLEADDIGVKRDAAERLRALGKNSNANRATIASAGAIPLLLGLIDSPDAELQEHAITAILNLSINDVNKTALTVAGAIPALVEVLANPWSSGGAKEAAAATLFSLSVMDDCKVTIGDAGAIPHLVDLLRNGTPRGRKDAVTALFNLSIFSGNKVRILKAKAVPLLLTLVRDVSVREKCIAVLANLSTMKDGRSRIAEAGGVAVLVDQLDVGTPRSKENAAATLLQLGVNSPQHTAAMIQAGAISPLLALSQDGTPRGKEKALALIRHFRELRKADAVRGHQTELGVGTL